ncbi:hypothetical protein LTR92_004835 [Exophiala xenobiotica]|nr:hypothetical protein LTR92_004835 [Exophiala xenobiotica]
MRRYMSDGRKPRYAFYELFNAGNIDDQGGVLDPDSPRAHYGKILPPGNGGNTEIANSRTIWDKLDPSLQKELLEKDCTVHHSIAQSRKFGSSKFFEDLDQTNAGKNGTPQTDSAHAHHIEGISKEESDALIKKLLDHVTRKTNTISVDWRQASDTIIWNNRCTLNKANGGSFEGKYRRDLRRTTVHDDSSTAWGLNEVENDTEKWIVNHAATKAAGMTKVQG